MSLLNQSGDVVVLTLQKSMSTPSCGPLSSSSSGHIAWEDKYNSPKLLSTATSPIKVRIIYISDNIYNVSVSLYFELVNKIKDKNSKRLQAPKQL